MYILKTWINEIKEHRSQVHGRESCELFEVNYLRFTGPYPLKGFIVTNVPIRQELNYANFALPVNSINLFFFLTRKIQLILSQTINLGLPLVPTHTHVIFKSILETPRQSCTHAYPHSTYILHIPCNTIYIHSHLLQVRKTMNKSLLRHSDPCRSKLRAIYLNVP